MFIRDERHVYGYIYPGTEDDHGPPDGPFGIDCLPGHCAVEMLPCKKKQGAIYLPDEYGQTHRSDAGYVLSAGKGVPLSPLDLVLVAYGHGSRVKGYSNKVWNARETVVFTGCAGGEMVSDAYGDADEPCCPVPWWESIAMRFENGEWAPLGRRVRIRLRPVQSVGGIHLARKRYQPEATVVSMGVSAGKELGWDGCVKPGDTVAFDEGGIIELVGTDDAIVSDFSLHALVLD